MLRLLWPVFLAAPAALGQNAAGVAERFALYGSVISVRTGAPLKGAEVHLRRLGGGPPLRAVSSAGGRFAFENLEPGSYRLSASRRGYVSQEYGARAPGLPGETLALGAAWRSPSVVVRLIPLGVISGRLADEDGEPVPEVSVQALRYTYSGGQGQLVTARTATTNDLGEYRLYGLAPGRYYISADYRPADASSSIPDVHAPAYFPGTNDPAAAVALEVAAGSEVPGVDFPLRASRTLHVQGRVVNIPPGLSADNVTVAMMPRASGGLGMALSRAVSVRGTAGEFEIASVVPGSYVIVAYTVDPGRRYTALQAVDIRTSDLQDVNLALRPGVGIAVRVVSEEAAAPRLGGVAFFLRPLLPLPAGGFAGRSKDDGTLLLEGVAAGEYALEMSGVPEGLYVKSARFAGSDVLTSGLSIQGARDGDQLEVVLGADGGQIDGHVVNSSAEPVTSAQVALVPDRPRRGQSRLFRAASTDQNGRFALSGIAPGDYRLFAWDDLGGGNIHDPDFLKHFEELGQSIKIQQRTRESVRLQVIGSGTAAGVGR